MRIVIACGGTGGHLFPGLAVADVLLARGHEVMVFISEKEIDTLATNGRTDLRLERLPSVGLPHLFSPAVLKFALRFLRSYRKCCDLYEGYNPTAVLGMGGFTSAAPILAGKRRGIPTFIHESNAIPGKANKMISRLASTVLLGFQDCAPNFPNIHCEITGTPIRKSLLTSVNRSAVFSKLGLRENTRTLLVMGGSQGAQGLNRAAAAALASFPAEDLQVIHLTGKQGEEITREEYLRQGRTAYVAAFFHEMHEVYTISDLAISRSGAASLTELSYFGIPSILIPFPYAAEDHQTVNAQIFVKGGAAILCKEENAIGGDLTDILKKLIEKPELVATMTAKMLSFSREDAAAAVVDLMERQKPR